MLTSRRCNNLINRIYERSLRTVYYDAGSIFQTLSENVIADHKNVQIQNTESHKIVNEICPPVKKIILSFRENKCNLRNLQGIKQKKTIWYGLKRDLYCTHQLWSLVPSDIKTLPNANLIESKIKHSMYWMPM